jgi:hypothetical protein
MSYDVSIVTSECSFCGSRGTYIEVPNVTWNNSKIFLALGVHPYTLKGMLASDAIPLLQKALQDMTLREDELSRLAPSNGWGGVNDSRNFIETFLEKCRENLNGKVHVS